MIVERQPSLFCLGFKPSFSRKSLSLGEIAVCFTLVQSLFITKICDSAIFSVTVNELQSARRQFSIMPKPNEPRNKVGFFAYNDNSASLRAHSTFKESRYISARSATGELLFPPQCARLFRVVGEKLFQFVLRNIHSPEIIRKPEGSSILMNFFA